MTSLRPRRSSSVFSTIEMLEPRQLLAGVQFNFLLNDPTGLFANQPLLVPNLQAISQILAQNFDGKGSIEVEITPNRDYAGGPAMAPSGVQFVSSDGYFTTVEYNTAYEARTEARTLRAATHIPGGTLARAQPGQSCCHFFATAGRARA